MLRVDVGQLQLEKLRQWKKDRQRLAYDIFESDLKSCGLEFQPPPSEPGFER